MRDRIVLATFGTHGDVHPFIAVALALQRLGLSPVIASHAEFQAQVETAGIAFAAIGPSLQEIETDLGLPRAAMLRAARDNPKVILTRYFLPYLEQSYRDSIAAVDGAALVFTHTLAFGARLAAEKLGISHIGIVLQPYMLLSAYDPPLLGIVPTLEGWLYARGLLTTRTLLAMVRWVSARWVRPVHQFRDAIGLPRSRLHPFMEGAWQGQRALGLYSRCLGDTQPDHPSQLSIVGFAFYDGAAMTTPATGLEAFLRDGPPPIVFTLGTSAVHDGARFAQIALQAASMLGERAILVLDDTLRDALRDGVPDNVRITSYLPYSQIFPYASLIVHHGGIGTTAQALRAGHPQLIAPYFADQPDNAARVARLKVGRVLPLRAWRVKHVAQQIESLLMDQTAATRARELASAVAAEDGATAAARIAQQLLR